MKKKLSIILAILLVLTNMGFGSTNSYAVSNIPLENLTPGDKIIFADMEWIILDPSTGFITLAANDILNQWNWLCSNDYENSSIKTYLNEIFLNSLGDENKDLIQEVTWNIGPVLESDIYNVPDFLRFCEELKKTDETYKVGLLTCSEYINYRNSSVLNPIDWANHWLLTPVMGGANNEAWSVGVNGNLSHNDGCYVDFPLYVRPAMYLKSGLFVSADNKIKAISLGITTEDNKTISDKDGYNTITISGTVQNGVGSEIYYRVDGNNGDAGTKLGTNITIDDETFSKEVNLGTVIEGNHILYIWADGTDINKSIEVSRNFKVDKTPPQASLSWKDGEGHTTGKYKEGDIVTITAVFSEDMKDTNEVKISFVGANTFGTDNMTRVDATHYSYDYIVQAGNGTVDISLSTGTDLVLNTVQSEPTSGGSFEVDNTAPTVSLTYEDQDGHIDGKYKKDDTVTITATFNEEILAGVLPQITITEAYDLGPIDMTRKNSTTYEYSHTVGTRNGTATCSISSAKDFAGNVITEITPKSGASFTVDNIAPTALLSGGDHLVGSGAEITDGQSNETGTIYLYKDDKPGYPTPTLAQLKNEISNNTCTKAGITMINNDTVITAPTVDGTYSLFSVDEAGNVSEASANTVTVDQNIITVNAPIAEAVSDTEIKITPKAWTGISLATEPYLYNRDGGDIGTWTTDFPYIDTSLSPNTKYIYKYKAKNTLKESEYSQAVSAYTLALNPESVSQSSKTHNSITIKITNDARNGEAPEYRLELKLKDAGETGENIGVSEWSCSTAPRINGLNQNTEYELWIQTRNGDGIENIKYKADEIYKTDIYIPSNSGGSSKPKKDINGDEAIEEAIQKTGEARLLLENDKDGLAQIIPNTIQNLSEDSKPLIVENKGVSLNFKPKSLITPELTQALGNPNASLELGVRALTDKEKKDILKNAPLGESAGIFEIGEKVFDFTAQITIKNPDGTTTKDKIDQFKNPVAVTIDLSDLELTKEEIEKLTGVRYEKDEKGNINLVKLSGEYDSTTKTFTFYTEKFSLYGVAKAEKITEINLTIDSLKATVNGKKVTNDVAPAIINDRTMVPVRFIAESFGSEVEWIGETRTVVIKLNEKILTMEIDKPIEGFDTPPTIVNNRTLVPLRYVSETLGANVLWFPESKSVQIVR